MDIEAGSIVCSAAGRDTDRIYVVLSRDGEYCFLCDGRRRRFDNPKKKKLKHLKPVSPAKDTIKQKLLQGERLTNEEVRNCVAEFAAETDNE